MPNNGTPYDKYFRGWKDDGDPPYSRQHKNNFAINEGLDDWEASWGWRDFHGDCYCGGHDPDDLCYACRNPAPSDAERMIAARRKKALERPSRWGGRRRFRDTNPKDCVGDVAHTWDFDVYKWLPREGYTNYYTKKPVPHYMERRRFRECEVCGRAQEMRGGWRRGKTRDMEHWELEAFHKELDKRDRWKKAKPPKTYGEHEDGTPVYRNEFKQGPKKRLTRKRPDVEGS